MVLMQLFFKASLYIFLSILVYFSFLIESRFGTTLLENCKTKFSTKERIPYPHTSCKGLTISWIGYTFIQLGSSLTNVLWTSSKGNPYSNLLLPLKLKLHPSSSSLQNLWWHLLLYFHLFFSFLYICYLKL